MGTEIAGRSPWDGVVDEMFAELRGGTPRGLSYWSQQLAFGPVLVHAVGIRYRDTSPSADEAALLLPCVRLARAALGELPDFRGGDRTAFRMLAMRQARALTWGRRHTLDRLLARLGGTREGVARGAPPQMARPYPLLGFKPGERLAG